MSLGPWEIALVILVIIILFGGKKTTRIGAWSGSRTKGI